MLPFDIVTLTGLNILLLILFVVLVIFFFILLLLFVIVIVIVVAVRTVILQSRAHQCGQGGVAAVTTSTLMRILTKIFIFK